MDAATAYTHISKHLRGKCSFAVFDASRIMFEAADKNYQKGPIWLEKAV